MVDDSSLIKALVYNVVCRESMLKGKICHKQMFQERIIRHDRIKIKWNDLKTNKIDLHEDTRTCRHVHIFFSTMKVRYLQNEIQNNFANQRRVLFTSPNSDKFQSVDQSILKQVHEISKHVRYLSDDKSPITLLTFSLINHQFEQ